MKKLESLKSSKFEAFKENKLFNLMNIIGGKCFLTKSSPNGAYTDAWCDDTGNDIHCTDGSNYDYGQIVYEFTAVDGPFTETVGEQVYYLQAYIEH